MTSQQLSRLYIAGIGMTTPVGFDHASTVAAVDAGVNRFQESAYFSKNMQPFTMAPIPEEIFPDLTSRLNNVEDSSLQMGIMLLAADVALNQIQQLDQLDQPVALFLAGPEAYQMHAGSMSAKFIDYLIKQSNANIDKSSSRLLGTGRCGVIDAIDLAFRYLQQVDSDYVLVGGADSYQEEELLAFLDADDRLMAQDIMNGFIPGEGAGFLLLTRDKQKALAWGEGVISLSLPGIGVEKGHMYSEQPYLGDGLAGAITKALHNVSQGKITTIYSSMNGEQFWAKELGVALGRNKEAFDENYSVEHPADCLGDMGSACGAVMVGLAASSLARAGRPATHLVYCSSDQESRGAICVNYETGN